MKVTPSFLVVALVLLGSALTAPTRLEAAVDTKWKMYRDAAANLFLQGLQGQSEGLWRQAVAEAEKLESPWRLALSLEFLAITLEANGRKMEAQSLFDRSCRLGDQTLWPREDEAALMLLQLAQFHARHGSLDRAEVQVDRSLRLAEQIHGPNSASAVWVSLELATIYLRTQRLIQAEMIFKKACRNLEAMESPPPAAQFLSLYGLAQTLSAENDDEALSAIVERLIKLARNDLHQDPERIAKLMMNVASLYIHPGRAPNCFQLKEAQWLLQESCKLLESDFCVDRALLARGCHNLAFIKELLSEHSQAETLYLRCLELRGQVFGEEDIGTWQCLESLAGLYLKAHRYHAALKIYERVLETKISTLGSDDPRVAQTLALVAAAKHGNGEDQQALAHCREALKILEAASPLDELLWAPVLAVHTDLLEDMHRTEEAELQRVRLRDLLLKKGFRIDPHARGKTMLEQLGQTPSFDQLSSPLHAATE